MRLLTFAVDGRPRTGLELQGRIVDLPVATAHLLGEGRAVPDDMKAFLQAGEPAMQAAAEVSRLVARAIARGQELADSSARPILYDPSQARILAPVPRPEKIICLGRNYAEHALEGGAEVPTIPQLFPKFANAVVGPGDLVVIPEVVKQADYECEMAVVIGRVARRVKPEEAYDCIAGYTMLNDVSARDLQFEQPNWMRGKSVDTFAPMGPYIVTKDEIPDPHKLDIRLVLNGEVMQRANTSMLIFTVPFLVHHITKTITLVPGDVISTGTPSGVGIYRRPKRLLRPGDVMRVEVSGLGVLENRVAAEEPV